MGMGVYVYIYIIYIFICIYIYICMCVMYMYMSMYRYRYRYRYMYMYMYISQEESFARAGVCFAILCRFGTPPREERIRGSQMSAVPGVFFSSVSGLHA